MHKKMFFFLYVYNWNRKEVSSMKNDADNANTKTEAQYEEEVIINFSNCGGPQCYWNCPLADQCTAYHYW